MDVKKHAQRNVPLSWRILENSQENFRGGALLKLQDVDLYLR